MPKGIYKHKPHSEETKRKISENKKRLFNEGKLHKYIGAKGENNPAKNPKVAKKISLSKRGKKFPKISKALKDRTYIEIYGLEEALRRKKEYSKRLKQQYFKGKRKLCGYAKLMFEGKFSGENNPAKREEVKRKIGESNKGKVRTPETILKLKEIRAKLILPKKDTSIEIKIQNFLKELNIEFFTHQYMKIEHGYQCDIFIPSKNLIIECDGDFIHCNPLEYSSNFVRFPNSKKITTAQEIWDRDAIRTKELIERGYKVLRLWENEIKVMKIEDFRERLEKQRFNKGD